MSSHRTRIRAARATLTASALAAALAAGGCGGSSTQSSPSSPAASSAAKSQTPPVPGSANALERSSLPPPHAPNRSEHAPSASISASIPGLLGAERQIPKNNTCDGADTSLPVQWSKLPSGTAQLALFVLNLKPVNGKLFFDWVVAGLSPTLGGISAGALPPGAVVGRNSSGSVGYSICPATGSREVYVVRVVALPHRIAVHSGFDVQTLYTEVERSSRNVGLTGGTYTRR